MTDPMRDALDARKERELTPEAIRELLKGIAVRRMTPSRMPHHQKRRTL